MNIPGYLRFSCALYLIMSLLAACNAGEAPAIASLGNLNPPLLDDASNIEAGSTQDLKNNTILSFSYHSQHGLDDSKSLLYDAMQEAGWDYVSESSGWARVPSTGENWSFYNACWEKGDTYIVYDIRADNYSFDNTSVPIIVAMDSVKHLEDDNRCQLNSPSTDEKGHE